MSIKISGSVLVTDDGTEISETEFKYLDDQNAGSAKASAAVILGSSKEISGLGDVSGAALSGSGNLNIGGTVRLDGAADTAAAVASDSFYFMDADDNLVKKESMADYAAAIAGDGLKADSGVLAVDFNELTAADVNVAADDIIFIDADGNVTRKDSIADLATGMAGDGIAASSGVLAMDINELSAVTAVADADLFALEDVTDNSTKKMTRANLLGSALAAFSNGLTSTTVSGSGAAQFASLHSDSVNLDGGAMDGVIIGANEAAAATVTTLDASGAVTIAGAIDANSTADFQGAVNLQAALDVAGASTLAALTATTISGSGAANLASLHCDSVDLDGGAMDGVIIGANSAAAATVTTLDASGLASLDAGIDVNDSKFTVSNAGAVVAASTLNAQGAVDFDSTLNVDGASTLQAVTATTVSGSGAAQFASLHSDSVNLDGGAMDGVIIGANSAADATVSNFVAASAKISDISDGAIVFGSGGDGELSVHSGLGYDSGASTLAATHVTSSGNHLIGGTLQASGETNLYAAANVHGVFSALGNSSLGNATSDVVSVVGQLTSSAGMHISGKSGPYALSIADGQGSAIASEWVTHSDRGLKTNIQEMDNGAALDAVMKLQPSTYEKISTGKSEIGFIAQEVAQVVPEICALDANGEGRGIDYSRMSTLLAGALKAQQEQIAQLKEIVAKLQK